MTDKGEENIIQKMANGPENLIERQPNPQTPLEKTSLSQTMMELALRARRLLDDYSSRMAKDWALTSGDPEIVAGIYEMEAESRNNP